MIFKGVSMKNKIWMLALTFMNFGYPADAQDFGTCPAEGMEGYELIILEGDTGQEDDFVMVDPNDALIILPDDQMQKLQDTVGDNISQLFLAARAGNLDLVRAFLDTGVNVNIKTGNGFTPLHTAASWGHLNVAKELIARGADVNALSSDLFSPLREAIVYKCNDIFDLLINTDGINLDLPHNNDLTPLHFAFGNENTYAVERLIQKGARVDYRLDGEKNLLLASMERENLYLFNMFLEAVAFQEGKDLESVLNDINITVVLSNGHVQERSLLNCAVQQGKPKFVSYLISLGADVNEVQGGITLLMRATSGALNSQNRSDRDHYKEIIKILVRNEAQQKPEGETIEFIPLIQAVLKEDLEVVKYLLDLGLDPNVLDQRGQSPLIAAIYKTNVSLVSLLINAGAELNPQGGIPPLLRANILPKW